VLDRAKDAQGVPRCFYCFWAEATIADHFNPLAFGGPDTEGNLRAACSDCNSRKADQSPEMFLASEWLAERRVAA
jgi:5-methylcytosine-specific restriction endonuclease McrA